MVITLPPQLESALAAQARQKGVAPEALALEVLRRHLVPVAPPVPIDDWERGLFEAKLPSIAECPYRTPP